MATHLFEITMARDEIQVGWNGEDRDAALESLARNLAAGEPEFLWQYAVTRGASGPEVAPIRRVAFFPRHVVRVAPVRAEHPIVDLPE
jgi:hypothetical protein